MFTSARKLFRSRLNWYFLANIVLGYRDRVADGTVTADSELPTLPAINLQHPFLAPNRWRSDGDNAAAILVDFEASYTIGVIALLATNLTAAATFRLRLSASSNLSSPTYDTGGTEISAGVDPDYGHLIHILSAPAAGRYLGLNITDASLTELEAGRLWAGTAFQPTRNYAWNSKRTTFDTTRLSPSEGGQTWVDTGYIQDELRLRFEALTDAEINGDIAALRRLGRGKDILAVLNPGSANLGRDSLFGLITENLSDEHASPNRHVLDLVILERK